MEKSPISAGALFRKAALEGVNEAPFLDLHRDNSSTQRRNRFALLSICLSCFLVIFFAILFLPFPVVKRYSARIAWDPPPIYVATEGQAVVRKINVRADQAVAEGEELAALSSDEALHPNAWAQLEVSTIETKLQTLRQAGRVLTDLSRKLDEVTNLTANNQGKLDTVGAKLQEALDTALGLQDELVKISEKTNEKHLISDLEMMESHLAAAKEQYSTVDIARNAAEDRDAAQVRSLNISNMASDVQQRIANNNNEILSLILQKARLDPQAGQHVRSPIDGIISSIPPAVGTNIRASDNLFIIRPKEATPVVKFEVPVSEKAQIDGAQRATIRFPIFSGLTMEKARVRTTAFDRADARILSVTLDVGENSNDGLALQNYVGLNVNVYMVLREQSVLELVFGRNN